MSMTTHFQHIETTILPLPHPKTGQSYDEVAEHGLKVAISLLQDHNLMMSLSPLHIRHEQIPASADQAVCVDKQAAEFNVLLTDPDPDGAERINGGDDWTHYEIRDQVPVIFGIKKEICFQTALRNTESGMESLTDPGNTVTIHGRYDVSRTLNDPTTLTLIERTTTHCNLMLGWYIRSNLGSSHANIHMTIKAKFVEEMQKKGQLPVDITTKDANALVHNE